MSNKITFEDGYTVELTTGACVAIELKGQRQIAHVSYFSGPVPEGSKAMQYIRKAGNNPDNYLYAHISGVREMIVRAGNGVREMIEAAIKQNAAEHAAEEKRASEQQQAREAKALTESGLSEPVIVRIEYFDGYPMYAHHDGEKVVTTELKWKEVDGVAVAEKATLNAAVGKIREGRGQERKEKQERDDKHAQKVEQAKAEARETGRPVVIDSWTTGKCMNGNSSECSFDRATRKAMPDGSIKTVYTCCC